MRGRDEETFACAPQRLEDEEDCESTSTARDALLARSRAPESREQRTSSHLFGRSAARAPTYDAQEVFYEDRRSGGCDCCLTLLRTCLLLINCILMASSLAVLVIAVAARVGKLGDAGAASAAFSSLASLCPVCVAGYDWFIGFTAALFGFSLVGFIALLSDCYCCRTLYFVVCSITLIVLFAFMGVYSAIAGESKLDLGAAWDTAVEEERSFPCDLQRQFACSGWSRSCHTEALRASEALALQAFERDVALSYALALNLPVDRLFDMDKDEKVEEEAIKGSDTTGSGVQLRSPPQPPHRPVPDAHSEATPVTSPPRHDVRPEGLRSAQALERQPREESVSYMPSGRRGVLREGFPHPHPHPHDHIHSGPHPHPHPGPHDDSHPHPHPHPGPHPHPHPGPHDDSHPHPHPHPHPHDDSHPHPRPHPHPHPGPNLPALDDCEDAEHGAHFKLPFVEDEMPTDDGASGHLCPLCTQEVQTLVNSFNRTCAEVVPRRLAEARDAVTISAALFGLLVVSAMMTTALLQKQEAKRRYRSP